MATYDYSGLQDTSTALILKFGREGFLNRITAETYDPVAGTSSGVTSTLAGVNCVITNITKQYREEASGTIEDGDRLAIFDSAVEPLVRDTLTVGTATYSIVAVQAVNPGGTALIYKAQLRGLSLAEDADVETIIDGGGAPL